MALSEIPAMVNQMGNNDFPPTSVHEYASPANYQRTRQCSGRVADVNIQISAGRDRQIRLDHRVLGHCPYLLKTAAGGDIIELVIQNIQLTKACGLVSLMTVPVSARKLSILGVRVGEPDIAPAAAPSPGRWLTPAIKALTRSEAAFGTWAGVGVPVLYQLLVLILN